MLLDAFHRYFWLVPVVWICVYISDYALTLWGVRLYIGGVQKHYTIQSQYELNPFFQKDIAAQRKLSMRFLIMLLATTFLLIMARIILYGSVPIQAYDFAIGYLLLLEVPVHFRHFRNIMLFQYLSRSQGVNGQITYTSWLNYRISFFDFFLWSLFFGLCFFLNNNWLFLGGVLSCFISAYQHRALSEKAFSPSSTIGENPPTPDLEGEKINPTP